MNTNFDSLRSARSVFVSKAHPLSTPRKISRNAQRHLNIVIFVKACSYAHNLRLSIDRALIL